MHVAVSVICCPVNGDCELDDTVQLGGAVGRGCHVTVTLAAGPAPAALMPATEYTTAPALALVAWQVAALLVQLVHTKLVGEPEQLAVSVTVPPAIGVELLADTVQDGGAGFCHVTCTVAGALLPALFEATTLYVTAPAFAAVALHAAPLLVQLVHA